jgi:hypothetical protein
MLLLLVLLAPVQLRAQPLQPASLAAGRPPASAPSDEVNDGRWRADHCLLGLGYHSVTKVSVAVAAGLRRAFEARSVCAYGAAHLGLGGTRTEIGSAVTLGSLGSALGVSGGLLRTFGQPAGSSPWRTYVGGTVHLWPLLGIHTEVGAYTLLARTAGVRDRVVTWGVGFGY